MKFEPKNKIENDKYYTPTDLALRLINKTYKVIGKENITEIIEPAAGSGAFSNQIKDCIAYDLYPENKSITKQDFFKLELPYKEGRLIIGNPPFGRSSVLARQFIKHSNELAEYYAFILPASFLLNRLNLNILYSEHLGEVVFTNGKKIGSKNYEKRKVNCSFIIYKHKEGKIGYPKFDLKDIKVWEYRKGKRTNRNYDYKLLRWGDGQDFGRVWNKGERSTHSKKVYTYIKVCNQSLKNKIYKALVEFKPEILQPRIDAGLFTGASSFQLHELYTYLIKKIPELQKDCEQQKILDNYELKKVA